MTLQLEIGRTTPGTPKAPLCDLLVKAAKGMRLVPSETATRADIAYLDGHDAALAEMETEIVARFAALSVEEVARVIAGVCAEEWPRLLPETRAAVVRASKAQAVMNLLRKE